MSELTLGSLFDGIGGFPLAGVMCGIRPVWSSEIEPFPMKVTAARFPEMKQLGSVTDIDGAEIEPVDIITFGSPCQDLSVAGKQLGIHEGQRSNLFFEAVRIIKEMREADEARGRTGKSIRPRFAVWENVPGAFSSNKGADFKAVLEALAGVREADVSIPQPKRWDAGGGIVGNGWSVAWRVYDAQYWGVPQRRKRIYLVADFASERTPEILFERESVRGNPAESGEAGEGTADDAKGCAGGSGGVGCYNESGVGYWMPGFGCLRAEGENRPSRPTHCVVEPASFMGGQGAKARSIAYCDDGTTPTLKSVMSGGNTVPDVCYPNIARTLTARHDSSPCVDNGQNWICQVFKPGSFGAYDVGVGTLRANTGGISGGTENVCVECYDARWNGDGGIAPTLTGDHERRVTDYTAVCVGNGQLHQTDLGDKAGALNCMHDQQAVVFPNAVTSNTCRSNPRPGDPSPTITTEAGSFYQLSEVNSHRKYIVRRLTPIECARLQGFPDEWCEGLGGSDSAIYKAYGNGLALPCAYDVMDRIARFVEHEKEDQQ